MRTQSTVTEEDWIAEIGQQLYHAMPLSGQIKMQSGPVSLAFREAAG